MSSGKGVKQLQYQLFNGALFLLLSLQYTCGNAEGNVGCVYSNELCDKKTEWCFDDNAFGRCVYKFGYASDDLYRFELKYKDLEKLKKQLEELKSLGFGWKHPYTQCIVQIQLQTFKSRVPYTLKSCDQILKQEFSDSYQYEPGRVADGTAQLQDETYDLPRSVINEGVIKYEPDDKDQQHSNAGSYYERSADYENELMNQLRSGAETKPRVLKKSTKSKSSHSRDTPFYHLLQTRQQLESEMMKSKGDGHDKKYALLGDRKWVSSAEDDNYDDVRVLQKTLDMLEGDRSRTYTEGGPMYVLGEKNGDYDNSVYDKLLDQYVADEPDIFGFQRSERLDVKKPGPGYGVNDYAFRNSNTKLDTTRSRPESIQNSGVTEELTKKSYRNVNSERLHKEPKSEYEYVPNYGHALRSENLQSPLHFVTIETNNRNLSRPLATKFLGTIRNIRRLPAGTFRDLKVHNDRTIYFSVRTNIINYSANDISRIIGETIAESPIEGFDVTAVYVGLPRELMKPESSTVESVSCDADDSEFALLELSENSDSWKEADAIVRRLNSFFKLAPETLYCIKSSESEIAFKVRNNSKGLNASKVVDYINAHRDMIKKKLDLPVVSVGIRSHDHPTILRLETDPGNGSVKLAIIIFGVISAALVSIVTLYAVQRQNKIQEKLHGLARDKDLNKNHHQESFKNRIISSKPVMETSVSAQRITSLSRESDNSPSSRSSTSSWSEDPMTNMDVTTGHMVLAYMEDHLTNKARLDTEWAALCAYDADPCSVAIAQQSENVRKNRYVNALPYDHARVVLNALSNVNGSDYINASTITDHDPRNPAYIATQGPLENTVCDFWQMLWEQGCNIVVMLTRLIENDTSMSYRYWPSEGVDLYNIYEVHLVSEHIWCDDFIVRSFYLKNQVTTETRTITQFHFLAWPEGGIPPSAKSLLEFRRKVNKSFREKNHPIVVHCSDGVGRTGSYLLLDMVLNRISKGAKEIDIAATLEHIRDQRAGAVCTKQQFQFVLSAVAEEVQAVLKALPQQQQSAQDQTADNVAPLVQLSTDSTDQTIETAPPPAPASTTTLPDSDAK